MLIPIALRFNAHTALDRIIIVIYIYIYIVLLVSTMLLFACNIINSTYTVLFL
jgi:hypothetical protein